MASHIRPGITTDELDAICHEACIERNAYPSPLNYVKFPKSVCISVNEVICHVSLTLELADVRVYPINGL
jgi:methionyl aminopeptidase